MDCDTSFYETKSGKFCLLIMGVCLFLIFCVGLPLMVIVPPAIDVLQYMGVLQKEKSCKTSFVILEPKTNDVWGTSLPMETLEFHPHFEWKNRTVHPAQLSIIYQGKFDEEPSDYQAGDEVAILTTGSGDQRIGWNPPNNIFDGRWKMKLVIGDTTLLSETFGICSKG